MHCEVVKTAIGEAITIILMDPLTQIVGQILRVCGAVDWLTSDVLHSGDEIEFSEIGDASVDGTTTTKTRYLGYQWSGNDLMVSATRFHLWRDVWSAFISDMNCARRKRAGTEVFPKTHRSENAPVFGGKVAKSFRVQLHCLKIVYCFSGLAV